MALHVDSLRWLRPGALLVGTVMVDGGGTEDDRAPFFVLHWNGGLAPDAGFTLAEFDVYPRSEVSDCGPACRMAAIYSRAVRSHSPELNWKREELRGKREGGSSILKNPPLVPSPCPHVLTPAFLLAAVLTLVALSWAARRAVRRR